MLDEAISVLKEGEQPVIHSDRGSHYRWSGWIERVEKAQLTRSMSKKGCSPDNSAGEGFFGRLKNVTLPPSPLRMSRVPCKWVQLFKYVFSELTDYSVLPPI